MGSSWETVREIGRALEGVEEGTSYGTPALRVKKTFFARLREDDVLVLKVGHDAKEALLEAEPDVFFQTEHYAGYPMLLVRLSRIERARLHAVIESAWELSRGSAAGPRSAAGARRAARRRSR